jgi:hypothetical protein
MTVNRVVAATEPAFRNAFESFCAPRSVFDAQGSRHAEIDLRLVESIESFLIPSLGQWEQSDCWWHQLDCYGDGVRSLSFSADSFYPAYVPVFQRLLVGEHASFCILCQIHRSLTGVDDTKIGSLAIRSDRLLISYSLAEFFSGQI